jgi:hypothetical protein
MKFNKILTIFVSVPALIKAASQDYARHLELSILFYEAQRSGKLPDNNRIYWRGDSMLEAGSDNKVDLTGGYYDAGDNIKFNFPQASSLTLLSWSAVEWKDGYKQAGQWEYMKNLIKWGMDYFIKCHTDKYVLYGQVGNAKLDHNSWVSPENISYDYPSYKITDSSPGSDLAAETSAALVAASMVFRDEDPNYADLLLKHGKELYEFADKYRGSYDESIPEANDYYHSNSYNDELVWGAAWLFRATGEEYYKSKVDAIWDYPYDENDSNKFLDSKNPISWDDKKASSYTLMAMITGDQKYLKEATTHSDLMVNHTTTPGGLWYNENLSVWGSNRYASNAAFTVAMMTSIMNDDDSKRQEYIDFVKKQIDYILGDNPAKIDYVVGAAPNSPKAVHHRGASGTKDVYENPDENTYVLYGALAGGPGPKDEYKDIREDYQKNEVALDYNAAFQGLLAFLIQEGYNLPDPKQTWEGAWPPKDSNGVCKPEFICENSNGSTHKLSRRANAKVVAGEEYRIAIQLSGKYITAANNGNVHQWENLNDNSQVWYFEDAGNGKFAILSGKNRKLAMTVENGDSKNGNNILLTEYKNTAAQHFILHGVDDAYYITAECSGKASLDVYNQSYDNGANIDQWAYWGGECQKFYIIPANNGDINNSPNVAYLFAYFLGNAPDQERLSYAVSRDGYNFKALNGGKAVWASTVGTGCLRDPYIFKGEDGFYYLLATDMKSSLGWNSNRNLLSAKSMDLIHWTGITIIEIANKYPLMKGADRAWAPQAIYDREKGSYMIYYAARVPGRDNRTIMYYAYSKDMKRLETDPQVLFAPANGNDAIDSDIIFQNGKYYMYYKNETNKRIYLATASHANGPYSEIKQISEGNIGVEGPNIYKLNNSNKWLLMSDAYNSGYYIVQETTDLVNFRTVNRNNYSFNFTPRHGYVIPINGYQYNDLINAFPSNGLGPISMAVPTTTKKTTTTTTTTTTTATTTKNNSQPTSQSKCFSEDKNLGYPCCQNCYVIESDENGDYGIENGEWCSIPYSCSKSDLHENGYPYCKNTKIVVYTDDVEWGVENNEWCVIKDDESSSDCKCWSEKLGYPCCVGNTVYTTDESGSWGLENDDWCGIKTC